MLKKCLSVFFLLLALLPMTCAVAEVSATDMMGREIVLAEPATRIVALTASDCEILCALGCEDLIVGRGTYCDYPESILDIPAVESGATTNVEQIMALAPQVVFMSSMAQPEEHIAVLESVGIRVVVNDADTIEDVYLSIRIIGALMGKDAEAEALIADMQATFDDIAARSADSPAMGKTVYFEVSPIQQGIWTGGANTFMHELATLCGVTNVFGEVDGWAEVSEEQVLARNPDYIVTTTMYFGEGPLPSEEILARESWSFITAIANGAVFNADSNEITRPGPRLKNAALALYNFFNGIAE